MFFQKRPMFFPKRPMFFSKQRLFLPFPAQSCTFLFIDAFLTYFYFDADSPKSIFQMEYNCWKMR